MRDSHWLLRQGLRGGRKRGWVKGVLPTRSWLSCARAWVFDGMILPVFGFLRLFLPGRGHGRHGNMGLWLACGV
jgi:hypothetical protein